MTQKSNWRDPNTFWLCLVVLNLCEMMWELSFETADIAFSTLKIENRNRTCWIMLVVNHPVSNLCSCLQRKKNWVYLKLFRYAELPRVVRVAQMPSDPGERKKVYFLVIIFLVLLCHEETVKNLLFLTYKPFISSWLASFQISLV